MERIGYTILLVLTVAWLIAMVAGMIAAYPVGLIGIVALAGLGFLFAHVVTTRLKNKDDDYYRDNIDK